MPEVSNNTGFRGISFGVKAVLVTLVPVAGLAVFKLLFWLITNPRVFLYLWGIALAIGLLSEHYIREWRRNTGANTSENRTVVVTAITEEPQGISTVAHEHPQADLIIPAGGLKNEKKQEIPYMLEEEAIPVQKVSTKVISLVTTTVKTGDNMPPKDMNQATARTLDLESFMKPFVTDGGDTAKSNNDAHKISKTDMNRNYFPETEWGSINSASAPQSEMNIIFSGISKLKEDESTFAMKS